MRPTTKQFFAYFVVVSTLLAGSQSSLWARQTGGPQQEPTEAAKKTVEPVFRVSKLNENTPPPADPPVAANSEPAVPHVASSPSVAPHPLDAAVEKAHTGLANMQANIHDYKALLVKRERINGKLGVRSYIEIKIRNERDTPEGHVPFSIYMKFLKPRAEAGREVIWVNGQNGNNLIAHEAGLIGFKRFTLDPNGWVAMKGNKYPIYDAGLENLIVKLIEKAERDRAAGHCDVEYRENATINNRSCSLIEVVHNERRAPYEFYKAQIFIDKEMKIPIRFASYDWPVGGKKPQLIEEYTYINVKTNVGLTDMDFNPENPLYKFPK